MHKFWEKFSAKNEKLEAWLLRDWAYRRSVLCNHSSKPKEYVEKLESNSVNKKQKGLRKGHQEYTLETTQKE